MISVVQCSTATQLIEPIIQFSEAKIPPTYLCEELCTPGLAERISCHTKHLSKTYVFTLNLTKNIGNVKQVVVKSIENVVLEDDNADEVSALYIINHFAYELISHKYLFCKMTC